MNKKTPKLDKPEAKSKAHKLRDLQPDLVVLQASFDAIKAVTLSYNVELFGATIDHAERVLKYFRETVG